MTNRDVSVLAPTIPLTETPSCNLCGSTQSIPALRGPDRMHHLPGCFSLVRCITCGLIYQSPRPPHHAIAQLYPSAYEPFHPVVRGNSGIPRGIRATVKFVNSLMPRGGRLLDIGCGSGDFLVAMHNLFPAWELMGVEPNHAAAEQARQRGLSVTDGTFEEVHNRIVNPHVVTLWNVLEHLPNPIALLSLIEQHLAPGGFLCLAVPVNDSWEARMFGKYWVGWELPRHFYAYDRTTIVRTLNAAGFTIVSRRCLGGTYHGVVRSAMFAVEDASLPQPIRRLCSRALSSYLVGGILKPYIMLAEYWQRATILTIAARRTSDVVI